MENNNKLINGGGKKIDDLLNALENDTNASIMKLTSSKIKQYKNNILQQIGLERDKLKLFHKKLKYYRYCDDFISLQLGYYIRWIPLKNPDDIKLTNGAIIIDIKILDNGLHLLCKNNMNRIIQVKFDEIIIFQKISNQENIILSVLDYLDK
jgi:hypothetical protein